MLLDSAPVTHNSVKRPKSLALVGVFDGFGGSTVSSWLSKNMPFGIAKYIAQGKSPERALQHAFVHAEDILKNEKESKKVGSTALIVIGASHAGCEEESDCRFIVANAGECLAVSIGFDGTLAIINEPHTPLNESERRRVESAGGSSRFHTKIIGLSCLSPKEVIDERYASTFEPGASHVSRFFGGMQAKMSFMPPFLISVPEVIAIEGGHTNVREESPHKAIAGILVFSSGICAQSGARLKLNAIEKIVQPIMLKLIEDIKVQENEGADKFKVYSIIHTAAEQIVNSIKKAAEKECRRLLVSSSTYYKLSF